MRTKHRTASRAVALLGLAFVSSETHAAGTQFAPGVWTIYSAAGYPAIVEPARAAGHAVIVKPAAVVVHRGVAVRRAPVARRGVVVHRGRVVR
jgi:hypothetical protein